MIETHRKPWNIMEIWASGWVSQALFKYNRKNFMFDKHLKQAHGPSGLDHGTSS